MNTEEAATVLQIASTLDESEDKNLMTVATILRGMLGEIQRLGTESDKLRAEIAAKDAEIAVDAGRLRDAAMRVWGEDAHGCDTPDRLADAILGLRAQIADLKRGGVVVSDDTFMLHLDTQEGKTPCISINSKKRGCGYDLVSGSIDGHFSRRSYNITPYMRHCLDTIGIRTIPADRVLGEGEARIGMNELQMLRCFAGRRMSEREYDRLEAVRDAHEEALRAQLAQEPAT